MENKQNLLNVFIIIFSCLYCPRSWRSGGANKERRGTMFAQFQAKTLSIYVLILVGWHRGKFTNYLALLQIKSHNFLYNTRLRGLEQIFDFIEENKRKKNLKR
ncbi:MAG: hypothetical protein HUJ98_12080 [Bacteroidaceae bacterium]|nr:hypothetical protein [Bacteroidaceae bacterium]